MDDDRSVRNSLRLLLVALLACLSSGCVSSRYGYGDKLNTSHDYPLPAGESQIERGRPNVVIDGVGWVLGIPSKVLLWDQRMDNHDISQKTEADLAEYLAKNELPHVKVRLNEYDPIGEWQRLGKNKQVGAGWRYSVGALATLGYTILPGRLFGGDNYNPFTNTISIYSDHPAVALHEGGHAKDFGQRTYKGTYGVAYLLPFVSLNHEEIATSDALTYLAAEGKAEELEEAYVILYPAYGSHVAGNLNNALQVNPYSWAVTLGCVIPGHIIGRMKAEQAGEQVSLAQRDRKHRPGTANIAAETASPDEKPQWANRIETRPETNRRDDEDVIQTKYRTLKRQ